MLNLQEMIQRYKEEGLTVDLAAARVCQDILQHKIEILRNRTRIRA